MNEPQDRRGDVALFIDWENFKISLAAGHRNPNVSALKEEAANQGRVVVAKAYADWVTRSPELRGASQFINDPPALYAAGIEPVYVPTRLSFGSPSPSGYTRSTRVKNSVDVKMTTDCIETAHSHPNIDTFILVSGDSDFIHVINALRTMGKHVVVVGVSWSTSRRLADQVDGLIFYDADVDEETGQETGLAVRPPARTQGASAPSNGPELEDIIRAIEDIVREERLGSGTPLLTSIKQRLTRRYPNFDERRLGFSGFKKLMTRVAQEGKIKLITEGLVDWAIMADEEEATAPSDAEVAAPANGHRTDEVEPALETADLSDETYKEEKAEEPETPRASRGRRAAAPEPKVASQSRLEDQLDELAAGMEGLPQEPSDGQTGRRVADLIIMADTLEHREDVSHVAFNFLVGEVCQALKQGLTAEDPDIQNRWGEAASRNYVSKMYRALGNKDMFSRKWQSVRDEASGSNKRRQTFTLDHENPLVQQVLQAHWQSDQPEPGAEQDYLTGDQDDSLHDDQASSQQEAPFFMRLFRSIR